MCEQNMKSIIISSNSSGGGKTTLTLGIMKALIGRGYDVQGYKVGPDYIDAAFHRKVTGRASRNLDTYLMGEDGVKASYSRGTGDIGIIEGVMGLYDGKGVTSEYSTASIAKLLKLPILLVITPKAQSLTLCAEIKGIIDFENADIAGVILNNVNESYFKLLKTIIEKNYDIKVFGYLPHTEGIELKSRHLGLVQSSEIEDIDVKIEKLGCLLEKYVDLDAVIKIFTSTENFKESIDLDRFHLKNIGLRTAVAYDRAFSFYYKENLELLEELGEVVFFSPLKDKSLPDDIDFLYLGGGYPEVFIDELEANESMLQSIKTSLQNGLACYAECGGLMYLTQYIEGKKLIGFLNGSSFMKNKLQNFGYAEIEVIENPIITKGIKINCHEFHKSCVELSDKKIYKVKKESYDGTVKEWNCGYLKRNTIAAYAHVHFFGNTKFIWDMAGNAIKGRVKDGLY